MLQSSFFSPFEFASVQICCFSCHRQPKGQRQANDQFTFEISCGLRRYKLYLVVRCPHRTTGVCLPLPRSVPAGKFRLPIPFSTLARVRNSKLHVLRTAAPASTSYARHGTANFSARWTDRRRRFGSRVRPVCRRDRTRAGNLQGRRRRLARARVQGCWCRHRHRHAHSAASSAFRRAPDSSAMTASGDTVCMRVSLDVYRPSV